MLGWRRASIDRRRRQLANYENRIVAAIAGASSARRASPIAAAIIEVICRDLIQKRIKSAN